MQERTKCLIIGTCAGAANGFFGAGGGLFLVPLFTAWLGMEQKRAFATSVAIIFSAICGQRLDLSAKWQSPSAIFCAVSVRRRAWRNVFRSVVFPRIRAASAQSLCFAASLGRCARRATVMTAVFIGAATGILSGFGIGGGSLLILWLTMVQQLPQYTAAGINLLYFLCCAPAALVSHIRHHLIEKKIALWCILAGCLASPTASLLAGLLPMHWLRRGFGILLLILGFRELFSRTPKQ